MFGLVIDWLGSSVSPNILTYLRPMYSDLNTTLVLGLITIITFISISIKYY
jgi:F0F1-type ATP synthase membrane subunit a